MVQELSQMLLLLVPLAVMSAVFVVVPVALTRWRGWSPASVSLALIAAVSGVAFFVRSVQHADANPGGGAEGSLGTDVPELLVPPVVCTGLALLVGSRTRRRSAHRRDSG